MYICVMEALKLKASLTKRLSKFSTVSYTDRLRIAAKMNVSRPTIDNYINGKVSKLEFAERLVKLLDKISKGK